MYVSNKQEISSVVSIFIYICYFKNPIKKTVEAEEKGGSIILSDYMLKIIENN